LRRSWQGRQQGAWLCPSARRGGARRASPKKNNGCLPPGQAKKLYHIGQRFPLGLRQCLELSTRSLTTCARRTVQPDYRYYYGDGYVYQVDPTTMLISQVVSAILR
jgi:hypothetical protein